MALTESLGGSGGGGSALTVKDEGVTLSTAVTSIDVVGAGAVATNAGGDVTLTVAGRLVPSIVQSASIRGDTTIALPSAPTVGNIMFWIYAGFSGSDGAYAPAGFTFSSSFNSDGNNKVSLWYRFVVSGDTGSYSLSASDNQGGALLEVANSDAALAVTGGSMSGNFSGTSFSLRVPSSPYDGTTIRIVALEHDTANPYTIAAATGLTVRYNAPSGANHVGAVVTLTDAFVGPMTGSVTAGPSAPVYGIWTIVGKKA
jgi:hypothetical protein